MDRRAAVVLLAGLVPCRCGVIAGAALAFRNGGVSPAGVGDPG